MKYLLTDMGLHDINRTMESLHKIYSAKLATATRDFTRHQLDIKKISDWWLFVIGRIFGCKNLFGVALLFGGNSTCFGNINRFLIA